MATLESIIAQLDEWYPPSFADDWDRVGLVLGDPTEEIVRILLAVDPVQAVADEAIELGADLIICHHPLFLRGVHSMAATTAKGRLAHSLVSAGVALFTAHTNADSPVGGVSEAIAEALGLSGIRPLEADPQKPLDKIVVFVPVAAAEAMRSALAEAGAGAIGDYDSCSFESAGVGRFRPMVGADPAIGQVGELASVDEVRLEVVAPRVRRRTILATMRAAHPYEEPAYDVIELAALEEPSRGSGRIGELETPLTLRQFAELVSEVIPETATGVRVAGVEDQLITKVALCGGAGDFLLPKARAEGADVYVTSDLRHHPVSEFREECDTAIVDIAHYAAESMWLPVLRRRLESVLADSVEVIVSRINTDPWTFRA
jgi:dinuclear metal center YbgI/SA1388 family protein